MVSYTLFDILWVFFLKVLLPFGLIVLLLINLPLIIGGILGYGLGLLILPFQILYSVLFDKTKKNQSSNNQSKSQADRARYSERDGKEEEIVSSTDLYSLLGVSTTATKEEMRVAFKAKMMMNHPDKLASLDPELQRRGRLRKRKIKHVKPVAEVVAA